MAKYFMELTLVDYSCVRFLPSEIAAASLYIAMRLPTGPIGKEQISLEWTPTLEYYSMYSESKLLPCARQIALLVTKTMDGTAKQKVHAQYFKCLKYFFRWFYFEKLSLLKSKGPWFFMAAKCAFNWRWCLLIQSYFSAVNDHAGIADLAKGY